MSDRKEKDWFTIIVFSIAFLLLSSVLVFGFNDEPNIYWRWIGGSFFIFLSIMYLYSILVELFNSKSNERSKETNKLENDKIMTKENYHEKAILIMTILATISFTALIVFWRTGDNSNLIVWIIRGLSSFISILLIWTSMTSFQKIGPNEIGLILEWGKPMFQVGSGLIWTPFSFIWKLIKETSLIIEEQYSERESNGEVSQIYVTHGKSGNNSNEALENRITTTLSIVCRYRITDLKIFITTIGTKEHLRRQMRDIVVTAAQVEFAKDSVVNNYNKLNEINHSLKKTVEQFTIDWGVVVESVLIQNIDLGSTINDALRSISVAKMNMEVDKYNSQKIFFEGSAKAEVEKAFQYAKAEGYKVISQELGKEESIVLFQIDALAQLWKNNNADIHLFSGDLGDIFKMVTAFSKMTNLKSK